MSNESILFNILAAGGGAAAVSYAIFKFLGKSIVLRWFDRIQENYRQEQAKEFQKYSAKLETLVSGAVKLQELEHKIIPSIWHDLIEAQLKVRVLASPLFDDTDDLNSMTTLELDEFFSRSSFSKSQEERIRISDDRNMARKIVIKPMHLRQAQPALEVFRHAILKNALYLPIDIDEEFRRLHDQLYKVVSVYEMAENHVPSIDKKYEVWDLQQEVDKDIRALGVRLRDRLTLQSEIPEDR